MKKTLVIYNSLKNDICFVKLNVDEEIKYNELDDKAVMPASKFMLCHISTDPLKTINIVFNIPCGNVLVPHEFIDLYNSSKSSIKLISEKKLYIYGSAIEIPYLILERLPQFAISCSMWKSERDMRSLLSYFLKKQEIKNFIKK